MLDVVLDPALFKRPRSCGPIAVVISVEVQGLSHEIDAMKLVEGLHEHRVSGLLERDVPVDNTVGREENVVSGELGKVNGLFCCD